MMVSNFLIPTVDISPYLTNPQSREAQAVVAQIRKACKTSGFFQILGHGVPRELQTKVFDAARMIFDLSAEEKTALKSVNGRGYETIGSQTLQAGTKPDMKEGYYISTETPDAQPPYRPFRYPNTWPSEELVPADKFKKPTLEYHRILCDLSKKIMQIMAEGLPYGHTNTFDEFCTDPLALVRLLHYPPQPNLDDKDQLGAGAHTDFGGITLLLQDSQGGLQVLNEMTKEWIDVPPNPDGYVVNCGDMLDTWTKGEYRSNVHRVINKSGKHRYSIPFFFDGKLDYVLRPLDGSGDDEAGMTVEDFMRQRYERTYVN